MKKISSILIVLITLSGIGIVNAQPITGLWTGCVDSHRGIIYDFQQGETPQSPCRTGDYNISLYDKTYVDNLTERINKIETLLTNVTRTENDIYFDSVNVHIRSGTGSTQGTINGLGNVIIGYDELRNDSSDNKTGSNNLIIGMFNNYNSFGGIVTGTRNEISGTQSSAVGGIFNTASGKSSSVFGGNGNIASGEDSSISGGLQNTAYGTFSSISGGEQNRVNGRSSSVVAGYQNIANADYSSVTGGGGNSANGQFSSVSGGHNRNTPNNFNWVAGGLFQDS